MRKIRVLIVEDSEVVREFLRHTIGSDQRLEVCAAVSSAEEALSLLDQVSPDVISLDIQLPGMNGVEATRRIMTQRPTPVVILAASVESEDLNITMRALEAGALTVLEKPVGVTHRHYETLARRLCTQLVIMSQVRVMRQHRQLEARPRGPARNLARMGLKPSCAPSDVAMIGIASSTGGPGALAELLRALGPGFSLPVLVVQHMAADFLDGFATWLASVTPFPVIVVKHSATPAPGQVYLAVSDRHLCAETDRLWVESGDPVCGQCPSGTILFQSMARSLGSKAVGIVLTGMGEDGAAGLLALRRAGGHTIAQDEATAVVYGMPAAAVRLGGISESLPLSAIGPRVLELTSRALELC